MRTRRGNTAITVALTMTALVGFGALALDLGYRRVLEMELQYAADAAAMAGATALSTGTATDARTRAKYVAGLNVAGSERVLLDDADVEIGTWDATTETWTVDEVDGDAVRVTATRDDVPRIFAQIVGWASPALSREAIASAHGPGTASCGLLSDGDMSVDGNPTVAGSICSNANQEVQGSATIDGDVIYGPGMRANVHGGNQLVITGEVAEMQDPVAITWPSTAGPWNNSTLTCPSGAAACSTAGSALSLSGTKQLNLSAGRYYWSNVTISGQARINVTSGPVYVYVAQDLDVTGQGILNPSANVGKLTVYCGDDVHLAGNAAWYGTIYARDDFELGGGGSRWNFYGLAIAGDTMQLKGNVDVHVVGSLMETTLAGGGTTFLVH